MWTLSKEGGGSDLNQNCSRHFFPLGLGHVPEGGGLVDPNPNSMTWPKLVTNWSTTGPIIIFIFVWAHFW